jgi:hypothetical protein
MSYRGDEKKIRSGVVVHVHDLDCFGLFSFLHQFDSDLFSFPNHEGF